MISLGASWRSLAASAEALVAEALARGDDADAAEIAAEARAEAGAQQLRRRGAALRLTAAIACAHPEDARALMSAALEDLGAGLPGGQHPMARLREDAAFWADIASEAELGEFAAAALRRLDRAPLGLPLRKRLLAALFSSLPDKDRRAFLARVDPRGIFQGRG